MGQSRCFRSCHNSHLQLRSHLPLLLLHLCSVLGHRNRRAPSSLRTWSISYRHLVNTARLISKEFDWNKLIFDDIPEKYKIGCHIVHHINAIEPQQDRTISSRMTVSKEVISGWSWPGWTPVDILVSQDDRVQLFVEIVVLAIDLSLSRTLFGWVLEGSEHSVSSDNCICSVTLWEDSSPLDLQILCKLEKTPTIHSNLSAEEQQAVEHFDDIHHILPSGRFAVSFPHKEYAPALGELQKLQYASSSWMKKLSRKKYNLQHFQKYWRNIWHLDIMLNQFRLLIYIY